MARIRDIFIAVLFLAFIGITAIETKAWSSFTDLATACVSYKREGAVTERESIIQPYMTNNLLNHLPYKELLIEWNGALMKRAGTRSYYNNTSGINITNEGYNVGCYPKTSTDYEVGQMIGFKKYLDEKGIQLLYVNEPAKYIDDDFYQKEFGGESYLNRNADLFLSRIDKAGINYIDLRENILEEGMDSLQLFYRTDHHWTVPASKWAAEIIAERLNADYGYNIDLNLYDDNQFHTVFYQNAWLGEQGKKVARSYIGLDDYVMMEPAYSTDYTISKGDEVQEGDFEVFINKDVYEQETDHYMSSSWHYSYKSYVDWEIHNNNVDYGNVLVLGDSYESSMVPFFTLGIQDVCVIIPRDMSNQSIRDIVEAGEYDTVIIAYAQFMIGAHDNEKNANYRMFVLE